MSKLKSKKSISVIFIYKKGRTYCHLPSTLLFRELLIKAAKNLLYDSYLEKCPIKYPSKYTNTSKKNVILTPNRKLFCCFVPIICFLKIIN